jgi:hypothetical protein
MDTGNTLAGAAAAIFDSEGSGSQVNTESVAIACSGSIAVSTAFAQATSLGQIVAIGAGWSGCAGWTGPRYFVDSNAQINTGGGGANYFPGNSAGSSGAHGSPIYQ